MLTFNRYLAGSVAVVYCNVDYIEPLGHNISMGAPKQTF